LVLPLRFLRPSRPNKAVGVGKKFKGPIGLQLYSLRANFAKTSPAHWIRSKTLDSSMSNSPARTICRPRKLKQMLDERGLVPVSCHFPYESFRDDPEAIAKTAKTLGLKYAGVAWIPHKDPFDEKTCRDAAAVFNKAGATLAKSGIKFFYHTAWL
jgi:hypothetical protein